MPLPALNFEALDWIILLSYFSAILTIGLLMSKKEKSLESFVAGNRSVPWFAVLCSIVATEISAATFVGVPAAAYGGNMNYLQMGIGSLLARFVVGSLFLTAFYAAGVLTIYEFLETRFGKSSRLNAAIFFLLGRILASGARLLMAAMALAVIFEIPFAISLSIFTIIAVVYTGMGGIRAVIWTDVIQAFVFISGGIAMLLYFHFDMGWTKILEICSEAGKTEIFNLTPKNGSNFIDYFKDPMLLPIAVLNGFIGTVAALGTDQDLTQRMLTCKDAHKAKRSVILSGVIGIPVSAVFLLIGAALYAWVQEGGNLPHSALTEGNIDPRKVFPSFISGILPSGLKGLLLAGIFASAMSSIDSALGSLSSSAILDIYKPWIRPKQTEKHYLLASQLMVIAFGGLLASLAWLLKDSKEFLFLTFKLSSIPAGALLGIFLLGIMTQKGSDKTNIYAMLSGALIASILLILIETEKLSLAWSWVLIINTIWTFIFAYFMSKPLSKKT